MVNKITIRSALNSSIWYFLNINCNLVKKNPNISALKFENISFILIRAFHLKGIIIQYPKNDHSHLALLIGLDGRDHFLNDFDLLK